MATRGKVGPGGSCRVGVVPATDLGLTVDGPVISAGAKFWGLQLNGTVISGGHHMGSCVLASCALQMLLYEGNFINDLERLYTRHSAACILGRLGDISHSSLLQSRVIDQCGVVERAEMHQRRLCEAPQLAPDQLVFQERRVAWDGRPYVQREFADFYGERNGLSFWESAGAYDGFDNYTLQQLEDYRYHRLIKEAKNAVMLISARERQSNTARSLQTEADAQVGITPDRGSGTGLDADEGQATTVLIERSPSVDMDPAELNHDVELALVESRQLAERQETEMVVEALFQSKLDMQNEGSMHLPNDVILVRLTDYNDEVHASLLTSPQLEHCRELVCKADCDLQPSWGNGLKSLVPILDSPFAQEEASDLRQHHVVIRRSDIPHLKAALRFVSYDKRPKVRHCADLLATDADGTTNASGDPSEILLDDMEQWRVIGVMEQNTLVHFKDISEASNAPHSAP